VNCDDKPPYQQIAELLRELIQDGGVVEIDDFGVFIPGPNSGFRFIPNTKPHVFIAYVQEDLDLARRLYADLSAAGMCPWLDKNKLMPGQNWPRAIETAIDTSDFFVPCFSRNAVSKRGAFHSELRYALECANRIPLDEIFLVPIRMDECTVPDQIAHRIQCVDLFPDWDLGLATVVRTIHREVAARKRKQLLPG
jgi:hypothetical protein